jgi:hypothetical protein
MERRQTGSLKTAIRVGTGIACNEHIFEKKVLFEIEEYKSLRCEYTKQHVK